jgi:hypothetical protein
MSSNQRREDKKRRREKRQAKRDSAGDRLRELIKQIDRMTKVPLPATFPGGCDPTTRRPDALKFEFAQWVGKGPGGDRMRRFEKNVEQGLLWFFPEVSHWAMEEYLWHGAPDAPWQPVDAFLTAYGARFPPAAQAQLKLWKQAKIGFYEVGAVADDLVSLRERDPLTFQPVGDWMRAIALNIGGVNFYAQQKGMLNVTYLSPWAPEQNIYCAMGYGMSLPEADCASAAPIVLGMRNIQAAAVPLPFRAGKIQLQSALQTWIQRDWFVWMKERVRCPFQAVVMLPEKKSRIITITDWVTQSSEEALQRGLRFSANITEKEVAGFDAAKITPLEFGTPTAAALAEYNAFRMITGELMRRGGR